MALSSAGRPPPAVSGMAVAPAERVQGKTNRLEDLFFGGAPPRLLTLLCHHPFLHLLIHVCLAEALMPVTALLSRFCHHRSSKGVIQLL